MKVFEDRFKESVDFLREKGFGNAETGADRGLVLGTAMGAVTESLTINEKIAFADIPGLPRSSVGFQKGSFISATIGDTPIICTDGRLHFYEGHSMKDVASITYIMHSLGIKKMIYTSAVGGINKDYETGDLVLVTDHINFCSLNPLIGLRGEDGKMLFPNLVDCYNKKMRSALTAAADKTGVELKEGVLAYLSGPAFETRAELKALRDSGADMIGWSMVPEVMMARALEMETTGICCISDISDPDRVEHVEIDELLAACDTVPDRLFKILKAVL